MRSARTGVITRKFTRRATFDFPELLDRLKRAPDVMVVIPVFNGGETVRECVMAVVNHTHAHRIIVVDDASTDLATVKILADLELLPTVEVRRNAINMGYTRTANLAIQISAGSDLVLLNSDTIVGPLWIERLRWTAYSRPNVASVSACSDNAGAMAMPEPGVANSWPTSLTWTQTARLVGQRAKSVSLEAPTAHGFCMYMRRDALDAIGDFDEQSFPRGYGEENDWSMRALAADFLNLLAPHVFVKHVQGVSFGAERARLIASTRAVVDDAHPSYRPLVGEWMRSDAMGVVRKNSADILVAAQTATPLPRTLYVLHASGGGTPETNRDLMDGLVRTQEAYLLIVSERIVKLFRWTRGQGHEILEWRPEEPFTLRDTWRQDYAAVVANVITTHAIEVIHVRHLINQPLTTVPTVAKLLGVPMILSTHDFYYICPTVHLLDQNAVFCGGVCTPGEGPCTLPSRFVSGAPNLKHDWIDEWRIRAGSVLEASRHVIATTRSASSLYAANYPRFAEKLRLIEHGRDLSMDWAALRHGRERRPGPLRIACPAKWALHKGTEYLKVATALTGGAVEWHMLGGESDFLGDGAVNHGPYARGELREILDQIDPDFVGLFSIWPETYSHTLTEAWALGIPVLATDLGAVADRIRDHGGGHLFAVSDPSAVARFALDQADALVRGDLNAAAAPRHSIRSRLSMAEDYALLYHQTRESIAKPVIGYVVRGEGGIHPGSTHVRLRLRMTNAAAEGLYFKAVNAFDFARGADPTPYSRIIVQRDAVGPDIVDSFISRCAANSIPYNVELDDDLLSDDARRRLVEGGYDEEALDGLATLIRGADEVSVSTDVLKHRLGALHDRIVVVPNELDDALWTAGAPVPSAPILPVDEVRVLYMGSSTHADDLALLRDVFTGLTARDGRRIVLDVVGVSESDAAWFTRVPIPRSFDQYPRLVAWLRGEADRWHLAVAPLRETPFNEAKSDLKFLEYTLLGLPTIASRVGPYKALDQHGATLVPNNVEAWRSAILASVDDPAGSRLSLATSRSHVLAERTLASGAGMRLWLQHLDGASVPQPVSEVELSS